MLNTLFLEGVPDERKKPEIVQRVYKLITGGREFESRRKDSLGT